MSTSSPSLPSTLADRHEALLQLLEAATSQTPDELHSTVSRLVTRCIGTCEIEVVVHEDAAMASSFRWEDGPPDRRLSKAQIAGLGVPAVVPIGRDRLVGLRLADHFVGWLRVGLEGEVELTADQEEFLLAVARTTALFHVAVGGAAGEEISSGEIAHLYDLARELTSTLEIAVVVERIAELAHQVTRRPVVLWMVEGERSRAVARAGGSGVRLGEEQLLTPEVLVPLRRSATATILRPPRGENLFVPLSLGSRSLGFLEIETENDSDGSTARFDLLFRLAAHAATALENARLHTEVRRLSLTDPLVQLPNRRQLDLFLERECAAAVRGRPLAMVLYDLDHFKRYNDEHGHRAGDLALIRFAEILRAETRAMNLAVRFGGEEFAAVLAGSDLKGAAAHAERVRRRVQESFDGELTVSGGVAEWGPGMESAVDLIVAADRALYRAKLDGRNRVHVSDG
ncbi:MAG: sensor domain-containing diguanylate cyclase [Gemmatimonadota bacterium]